MFLKLTKYQLLKVITLVLTLAGVNSFVEGNKTTAKEIPSSLTPAQRLEQLFMSPPANARPWVHWYFMDGNLTRDGMMADLAATKKSVHLKTNL